MENKEYRQFIVGYVGKTNNGIWFGNARLEFTLFPTIKECVTEAERLIPEAWDFTVLSISEIPLVEYKSFKDRTDKQL